MTIASVIMPRPMGWRHMHWRPLSVCLSVCPVLDPKSRMESRIASWKLAGRKPGDPLTPISSSKGQTLAGMGEILATRSLCVLHGHNERLEYTIMTAKLNALGGCSKHHLQGGGMEYVAAHYRPLSLLDSDWIRRYDVAIILDFDDCPVHYHTQKWTTRLGGMRRQSSNNFGCMHKPGSCWVWRTTVGGHRFVMDTHSSLFLYNSASHDWAVSAFQTYEMHGHFVVFSRSQPINIKTSYAVS